MAKLILRKFRVIDIGNIMKLFVNNRILNDINLPKKAKEITKSYEMKWLKNTIKNYKLRKPEEYNLAIIIDGDFIGGIGLHKINHNHNNAEVGYWIGEPYWGKNYATLALRKFLKEIFRKFKLVRVVGYVNDYNRGSQRVLEKNGFKFECIRKKAVKKGNKYINDKQYSLIR